MDSFFKPPRAPITGSAGALYRFANMTDRIYYIIMTTLAWLMIGLGLASVGLYVFGLNPGFEPTELNSPIVWATVLLMVRMAKLKDQEISRLESLNRVLLDKCDELHHRLEDPNNRINE